MYYLLVGVMGSARKILMGKPEKKTSFGMSVRRINVSIYKYVSILIHEFRTRASVLV
jgi:hypothetical protein